MWTIILKSSQLIHSFTISIGDPNPDSPANPTAAQLFMQNKPEYVKRVKLCVEESYIDDPDAPLDLRKPLDETE